MVLIRIVVVYSFCPDAPIVWFVLSPDITSSPALVALVGGSVIASLTD